MKYGYFDDANREYIITNPHTPTKWINYIGTLDFGGFIDHLGGSVICKGDPALNRIVKYLPQLPDSQFNGETIYIQFKDDQDYMFSPFYVPTLHAYDDYQCRVGLGYNKYVSKSYGIHTEITTFVPIDSQVVLKKILIRNERDKSIDISVTPVVEYTHFDALKQFTNADWVPQTMMSEKLQDGPFTILNQYAFMHKDIAVNYFTSNQVVDSFCTDRRKFLKDHMGGSWQKPLALLDEKLSNYEARRGDNIAAIKHQFKALNAGEEIVIITQLGQYKNFDQASKQIWKYRDEKLVDQAFDDLKKHWDKFLNVMQVETPSHAMNSMINIHNPKQCYTTKNWSRYLSLYQLGLGARGIGIRDSSQDIMGVLSQIPEEAKNLLKTLLSMQRREGSSYHQYNPKNLIASEGDSNEEEEAPYYYGDDHLWLIYATCEYLKETGDFEFLKENIAFYDKDKDNQVIESGSVDEHLKRALDFTKNDKGQNGLPHLGFADWNDTVNLPKGSESLFNANLYGVVLKNYIGLLEHLNRDASEYISDYRQMKKAFEKVAWDGEWFIRYIDHHNQVLGSKENMEGKIFTNGQSWSIMSGFAGQEKGRKALDSVKKYLNTRQGIKLSSPGFNGYDPEKGGVSTYPPGAKENGGIFLHSNPWVMIAETLLGNGDQAFEYYNQINPVNKNDTIDRYELAPYVYPQNILGDEHPQFGLARNCWLSGTASWNYQAVTQYILGIKATYEGLRVNPCIPSAWDGFEVKRVFRGINYKIKVENPNHVSKGVKEIYVDGQLIKGLLPYKNKSYEVRVVLGE